VIPRYTLSALLALTTCALAQTSAEQQHVAIDGALLRGLSAPSRQALESLANPAPDDDNPPTRRKLVRELLADPEALTRLETVIDKKLGALERDYARLLDEPVRAAYHKRLRELSDEELRQVAMVRRVWRNYILKPSTQLHFQQHFLRPATKVCELVLPDVATIETKQSKAQLRRMREFNGYRDEVRLALGLDADPTTGKQAPTGIPMPPLTEPRSYDEHLDHLHRSIAIASTAAPREAQDILIGNADKARLIDKEEAEFVLYANEIRAMMGVISWSTDILACAATRDHSKDRVDGNASGHFSKLPGKRGFTDRLRRFGTGASSEGAGGGGNGRHYLHGLSYGGGHTGPLYSMKRNRVGVGRFGNCYTSVYAGQKNLFHRCQASTGELFMPPGIELADITDPSLQDIYHALLFENYGGARQLVKEAKAQSKMDKFVRSYFAVAIEVEADWHVECITHFVEAGDLYAASRMIDRARSKFGDAIDKRLRPFEKRMKTNAGRAALAAGKAYAEACASNDKGAMRAVVAAHPKTVYAKAAQHYLGDTESKHPTPLGWFLAADRYLARYEYLTLE